MLSGVKEGGGMGKESQVKSNGGQGGQNTEVNRKKTVFCKECGISLCETSLKKHRRRFHLQGKPSGKMISGDDQGAPPKKGSENKWQETKCEVSSAILRSDKVSPQQSGKFGCDKCGKSFSTRETMSRHERIIHRGEKPQCRVSGCEATFPGTGRVLREDHERKAHGRPKLRCKFEGCSFEFCSITGLRRHRRTHLLGRPSGDDQDAPQKNMSENRLRDDLRIKKVFPHQSVQLRCDECGKSFSSKTYLWFHKKIVHRGEKPQCKVSGCEATFSSYRMRRDHERKVHGCPKLRCKFEGCSSEFITENGRRLHHRTHTATR